MYCSQRVTQRNSYWKSHVRFFKGVETSDLIHKRVTKLCHVEGPILSRCEHSVDWILEPRIK
jgi:hypothetical protein